MGGLTSILGGLVMFAIALWSYITGGFSTATLVFLVGAGVLFLRGAQGRSLTQAGDVVAPMDFVANPADAIVDAVTERVTGLVPGRAAKKNDPEGQAPAFDADAAIARYLENRPADLRRSRRRWPSRRRAAVSAARGCNRPPTRLTVRTCSSMCPPVRVSASDHSTGHKS